MKSNKSDSYNPNLTAQANGNFIGLPHSYEEAYYILIPMPWDVTTSSRPGTSNGPRNILDCSLQLDLADPHNINVWKNGFHWYPWRHEFMDKNDVLREEARKIQDLYESGRSLDSDSQQSLYAINSASQSIHGSMRKIIRSIRSDRKFPICVGGDHSCALGSLQAAHDNFPGMGILHFDAHLDLRKAYEGFEYSHASVFYNLLRDVPDIPIVSVGIRDYCEEEWNRVNRNPMHSVCYSQEIHLAHFRSESLRKLFMLYIDLLPTEIYVSLDVDVLEPHLCPNTGTPVPGGLQYYELMNIINLAIERGKRIVGFDICETGGTGYIDGYTSAKLIYDISSAIQTSMNN